MPGVITKRQLIDGVRRHLNAWPTTNTLNGAINSSVTTITLNSTPVLEFAGQRSLVEIEDEVMLVVSVDTGTNTMVVVRGYQGTTAAAHADTTSVFIHPIWGWTDAAMSIHLRDAFVWLRPTGWMLGVSETFTWDQGTYVAQVPTSSAIDYPNGNWLHQVEFQDSDGNFRPFYGWQVLGPYIRFREKASVDRTLHAVMLVWQRMPLAMADSMDDDTFFEPVVLYAAQLALNELKTNRSRYTEYSAALNDRASTPDELIRTAFDLKNQAILAKETLAKPMPPTYLSTYRDPQA